MNEHKDRYIGSWYTWSPYERYLILSDNSRSRLTHNYESFLRFREVREILNKISKSSLNTYEYNNEMHTKPFSSEVAAYTLNQIDAGIWSNNIKTIIMCHKIAGVYVPNLMVMHHRKNHINQIFHEDPTLNQNPKQIKRAKPGSRTNGN